MIAYNPTNTMPVSNRSSSHAIGFSPSACNSTTQAAHAAQNANARMCPMRRTSGGIAKVPMK